MISIGFEFYSKYHINRGLNWPASWTKIIRSQKFVHFLNERIHVGEDVYQHFVLIDSIDDNRIGNFNRLCYVCPKPGRHISKISNHKNDWGKMIGVGLMEHVFRKPKVVEVLMSDKGKWLKRCFKEFDLKCAWTMGRKEVER